MKSNNVAIAFIFALATAGAQPSDPLSGLGVEIGGGHNQLKWHSNGFPPISGPSDYNRQQFSLTPTFRLSYESRLFELIQITPFIGYDKFGGRSSQDPTGYQDEVWFSAVDFGLIASYRFSDFSIGPALKYNRLQKKTFRYYGVVLGQVGPRTWAEQADDFFFRSYSYNLGGRVSFALSHWTVSGEAWFGISEMLNADLASQISVHENHFRLLLGYRL